MRSLLFLSQLVTQTKVSQLSLLISLSILSFALASETRDSHHPYTGEMGVRLAPTCPDYTG